MPETQASSLAPVSIYFTAEMEADGGFTARCAGFSIFTQGDTVADLRANIEEAVAAHFGDAPPPIVIGAWVSFAQPANPQP